MADKPVILSSEPSNIKINIEDPNKPKPKYTKKEPGKEKTSTKLKHAFLGPDVDDVGTYILKEHLEPTGKRMLNNASQSLLKTIGNGIQVLLFGKVVSQQNGGVDYTSFSNPNIGGNNYTGQGQLKAYKVMDAVEVFTFPSRQVAEDALGYLRGRIRTYQSASVSDYYEYIGAPLDYMMVDRGWINLDNARVITTPEGYQIDLPRPISLKRG